MTETVKVRIAVCIQEDRLWSSAGWSGAHDDDAVFAACDGMDGVYHWIEAEIPIPRPTTIPATVSPAEGE